MVAINVGRRLLPFSKHFFSETISQISVTLRMLPPGKGGRMSRSPYLDDRYAKSLN